MIRTIIFISLTFMMGCTKCYDCTTTYKQSGTYSAESEYTQEFCGTPREVKEYEDVGTSNTSGSSGNYTLNQEFVTECK